MLFALLVFTSNAAQFVVTNDTLSINCEARTMEVQGGDKFKYTLYAKTTIGTPESLANRIVRGSVIDISDGYADTQKVVSAELVSDTNGVARFETTMSGLEDGNYLWRVGVWQTNGTYVKEIACDRLVIWSGCDTCSVLRVDLGNLPVNVTNNLVAPGAPNGYMPYVTNGGIAIGPAPAGGGGPTTGQVNRIRINGTNYQGDLDWEPAGLLRLAPTGLTINAYVGTEDVFAGLQSYASPLTNVIAWNLGGQPVGMSPLVPGYQLTTDGSNWYLGADAAGTAVATNAIYQLGHNGTIVGPLNTALFDSPFAVTALGGGTARVSIVEQPGIQLMVGSTNGLVITTTQYVWQTCTYLDQEIIDGSGLYDPTSSTFSITSGIYECTFQATPTNGNAASFQSRVMVGGTQTLHQAGAYRPELSALSKNGFAAGYYNTNTGTVSRAIIFPLITTTTINGLVFQVAHEQQIASMRYKDLLATLRYVGPVQ